jgi:hypothetical protein
MEVAMSARAAEVIYRCFNLVPDLPIAENDRDPWRW